MDFVKSGCEKSWAEVQANSFSFECRGCAKMKEQEVEMEEWRQLSGGGAVEDKVWGDDQIELTSAWEEDEWR